MGAESYKSVIVRMSEAGSGLPRALLAYAFSILGTMRQYSSSVFAPVIIDSPIQQEQDKQNHRRILEFIRDNRPSDAQLVMGVVDAKAVDFGGKTVDLTNPKRSVLVQEENESAEEELRPFVQKSLFAPDESGVGDGETRMG